MSAFGVGISVSDSSHGPAVSEFVSALSEWATDPSQITTMMKKARHIADAELMDLGILHKEKGVIWDHIEGSDEALMTEYLEHYQYVSPRIKFLNETQREGVFFDYMFIDEQEMRKDEFYNWVTSKGGRYTLTTSVTIDDNVTAYLGMARDNSLGHATPEEIARYTAIEPHFRHGIKLALALESAQARATAMESLHDNSGCGVIMLDAWGSVVFINELAEDILCKQLNMVGDGKLQPDANTAWARIFGLAQQYALTGQGSPLAHVSLHEPRDGIDGRAYFVKADTSALHNASIAKVLAPRVVVYIFPKLIMPTDALIDHLRSMFGLGQKEATVAVHLANGVWPKQIAGRLHIEESTVRSHIETVKKKVGTPRVSDIARIISEVNTIFGSN